MSPGDFVENMEPHYAGLVQRLTLVLHDSEDARDVAQDAYLRAWRAWDRFDGADPRASLHTIGLRLAFNRRRGDRRERGLILASNSGGELFVATTIDGEDWRVTDTPGEPPDLLFSAMHVAGDTAVAFGGPRNPDNGLVSGLPFGGWVGSVTPTTD